MKTGLILADIHSTSAAVKFKPAMSISKRIKLLQFILSWNVVEG